MTQLQRREFLAATGAVAASGALIGNVSAAEKKPIFRISLAEWSLNRRLRKREKPYIDNLDFAATSRKLGIDAIEYVNQFFKDKAKDAKYLAELNKRAADHNVKQLLIMIDGEGALGADDKAQRHAAVEKHYKWVEAAKTLGCHSIRVNARSNAKLSFEEQMKLAADGLRKLSEFGAKHKIGVIVENHGGLSSNGKWLAGVMKMVDHPNCGTLPDFGNFAIDRRKNVWYDRYQGVKELMPYAKAVSAKAYDFDPKRPTVSFHKGNKTETDFLKMMTIVLDAGYRGWVGIEAEGGMDQIEGIKATKKMLELVREKLTPKYS